jgi:nucleoporin GLE1
MLVERDRQYWEQTDAETEQLQLKLAQDLQDSIARHEAVRFYAIQALESTKRELQRIEYERIQRAQLQQSAETEQARNLEAAIRLRHQEEAELAVKEEKRIAEDAHKLQKTREEAERLRREREETDRRRQEEAAATAAATPRPPISQPSPNPVQQTQTNGLSTTPKPLPNVTSIQQVAQAKLAAAKAVVSTPVASTGLNASIQEREMVHQQYLDLHKRLKKLRTQVKTAGNEIKEWRNQRLQIKKLLGQLANDTGGSLTPQERQVVRTGNLQRRKDIIAILQGAQRAPGPTVDARDYMVNAGTLTSMPPNTTQVPAVFVYLLNMAAKAAINTIKGTAVAVTEAVGITVAFVFGSIDLRLHGESFIDVLLAKYHFVCPMLFGIYGKENTEGGRVRLGWPFSIGDNGRRLWIDEKEFFEEQTALAIGWASLTLRDFAKAKTSKNACPPWNYWMSIARITNTPADQVTRVHFIVLKNLLENHADKFIKFYGQAGTVALRTAIVVFPGRQGAKQTTERNGLEFLRDGLRKQFNITL